MKIAYFDTFSGISGDMILGALVDLGVGLEDLKRELAKLNMGGYKVHSKDVMRGAIGGIKIEVEIDGSVSKGYSRNLKSIVEIIKESSLKEEIKTKGIHIFNRLAYAEASVHRKKTSEIHFHEVGAIDAIVDVMGSLIGLDLLEVDKVYASKVTLGTSGFITCKHGDIPVPAPATLELLRGVPTTSLPIDKELTTPTGAAIISTLASDFGRFPEMVVRRIGYGAGTREDKKIPNMLRVILGESKVEDEKEDTFVIEANIDDMNPQFYDHVMEMLFEQGAMDVFMTSVQMKKNRPGTVLTVLASREILNEIIEIILRETTSIGLRFYKVERYRLKRYSEEVETPYGSIKVKISGDEKEILNIQPEYEACKKIALKYRIPIKKVYFDLYRSLYKKCL